MAPGGEAYKVAPAAVGTGRFEVGRDFLSGMNQDQMTDENKKALAAAGGVKGVAAKLKVNLDTGLVDGEEPDAAAERKAVFGENRYPEPPAEGWLSLYVSSFNDPALIVLLIACVVSLVLGMIEHPEKGWIEGVVIMVAVQIVAVVSATNDYNKEKQFRQLNAVKDEILVKVIRNGAQVQTSTFNIVVGDVIYLEAGDKIPTDGLFVKGSDCESNEASLTGEPEDLPKNLEQDPFMLSGCAITAGFCTMVVIAVGVESRWGRIKAKLAVEQPDTPLQEKLDEMVKQIGYIGVLCAVLTFIASIAMFYLAPDNFPGVQISKHVTDAFIIGVTIVVVAIPEGLPLAVTISLAYSTMKMLEDNNLIRVLAACETMGNATNICSDKTGTLTENRMTVVEGWFAGKHYGQGEGLPGADSIGSLAEDLKEGIALNSKAVLVVNEEQGGRVETVGSKTEGALLMMAQKYGGTDYLGLRKQAEDSGRIVKVNMFSSARKMMSVLVKKPGEGGGYRLYVKGASEIVLKRSVSVFSGSAEVAKTEATEKEMGDMIVEMAKRALRTIGIAHRDFAEGECPDISGDPPEESLTLDAIVGIIDPLREDVEGAVATCQRAGIMVRMVTGDNIHTARAIARQCGILTDGGECLEGPVFRNMTPAELDVVIPKLQVLARSSPDDKHTLVTRLNGKALPKNQQEWEEHHPGRDWATEKDKLLPGYLEEWKKSRGGKAGEVVGVTGDGTNDAPALKAGDVGLSMGLSGTEVAKEASDIVIMDDRFSSIVKAVLWGRSVFDNIRRFLQFQLTVNVVALLLTFLAALLGTELPLTPVMMLWVNLIMDTLGALALGTEAPTPDLLDRRPYRRDASLVNKVMWRNILVQSLYQLVLCMVLLLMGSSMFDVPRGNYITKYKDCEGNICPFPFWGTPVTLQVPDWGGTDYLYPAEAKANGHVLETRHGIKPKIWAAWANSCFPKINNASDGWFEKIVDANGEVINDGTPFTWADTIWAGHKDYEQYLAQANGTWAGTFDGEGVGYACEVEPKYEAKDYTHYTIIFNVFVFCQIFNEFNARSITSDPDIWTGLSTNKIFISVIVFSIVMQLFLIYLVGSAAECSWLSGANLVISIALGAGSLPLGILMRFIPSPGNDDGDFAGYDPEGFKTG